MSESQPRFLVTGAGGFIGNRVVRSLLARGYSDIVAFVRPSSRLEALQTVLAEFPSGREVRIITGDLLNPADCKTAVEGVSVVLHLAAGIDKSFAGAFMNSGLATRNLIEALLATGTSPRFVNVSSFAVYSTLTLPRSSTLDETCPLETAPQERADAYGFGKLMQDRIVEDYGQKRGLRYVTLRPGSVFGPGKKAITGRVGIDTFGVFLHLGGFNRIPLTYVDNCADAIVLAGITPNVEGEVFNVVDDDLPTSRSLLRIYKKARGGFLSIPVPYPLTLLFCRLWERYCRKSHGQLPAVFNRRRCSAEWKRLSYSNRRLKERLDWKPVTPMPQALENFAAQFSTDRV